MTLRRTGNLVPFLLALTAMGCSAAPEASTEVGVDSAALADAQIAGCVPAPTEVAPPSALADEEEGSAPSLQQRGPCPAGQVPLPKALDLPKELPGRHIPLPGGSRIHADLITSSFGNFAYVSASQSLPTFPTGPQGIAAELSVHLPHFSSSDGNGHTLAEVAAQSADGRQIVEVGWIVNPGDTAPHLFVYHWVNGNTSCYNGCGYVQYSPSIFPGMALPKDGSAHTFKILHAFNRGGRLGGAWWIIYGNSEWVGYFPDDLWSNSYQKVELAQWFGEVAMSPTVTQPCSAMGDGTFGSQAGAATMTGLRYYYDPNDIIAYKKKFPASASYFVSDPSFYNDGAAQATSFRYGGPGSRLATCR